MLDLDIGFHGCESGSENSTVRLRNACVGAVPHGHAAASDLQRGWIFPYQRKHFMKISFSFTAVGLAVALAIAPSAFAQVAGSSTTIGVTIAESTQLAFGWSAKKSILGKTVYNEAGAKIGKVDDLIVSTDKNVSYLIVGAGGFVGIGRHDVAIPVSQVQEQNGKLVMPGGSKEAVKAMPAFEYARDTARRDEFIATSERDIAKARTTLDDVRKRAGTAASEVKVKLDAQVTALDADVKSAEVKLGDMKRAGANEWRKFEGEVRSAMIRMNKSFESAKG
ncbi:MAG: PRC-barrel domain-containing protein [Ramlibacter sp.]